MPKKRTTGTGAGQTPEAQVATANSLGKGPDVPSTAHETSVTTTSTSGAIMLPGESHDWKDNGGELFPTEPTETKGKTRIYGRLELKQPDFGIIDFGGGPKRERYPLEFKPKPNRYAKCAVKGGKRQRPTVLNRRSLATRTRTVPHILEVSCTLWFAKCGTRSWCSTTFGCSTRGSSAQGRGSSALASISPRHFG